MPAQTHFSACIIALDMLSIWHSRYCARRDPAVFCFYFHFWPALHAWYRVSHRVGPGWCGAVRQCTNKCQTLSKLTAGLRKRGLCGATIDMRLLATGFPLLLSYRARRPLDLGFR
jgi:hypothetical protein